jgi:hypothetical protein
MGRSIYPTPLELVEGIVWPCRRVPRLKKAGLAGYELKMRFMWIEDDDEDYEPDIDVYWCKLGNRRAWHYMGSICDGLTFHGLPTGTMELLRYLNDLEDKRMDSIFDIIEEED